jgi:citrate synthase
MITNNNDRIVTRGLREVIAAETRISFVDPLGALYYSGYNIDDIVGRVCYEEVVHLLLYNKLPNRSELANFRAQLVSEMSLPEAIIKSIKAVPPTTHPMEVLRTEVSHLSMYDPDPDCDSDDANKKRVIRLIAKFPVIVATFYRLRTNQKLFSPNEEIGFAENFLYMFRGTSADKDEKDAIDRFMTLHADHGFNASTFAARVTAGTNSDIYSAVTSAIGTLKGSLHGGASERVMSMLFEVTSVEEVEDYIQGMLDDQRKIMGFGHRVYMAEDPRAKHLREIGEMLCHKKDKLSEYKKCMRIEAVVYEKKKIFPNVDFYAALVMHALGVPKEFFTAFFASSRVSGWIAHVLEQYADAVLIRPTSKYTGEYGRPFVPIEKR